MVSIFESSLPQLIVFCLNTSFLFGETFKSWKLRWTFGHIHKHLSVIRSAHQSSSLWSNDIHAAFPAFCNVAGNVQHDTRPLFGLHSCAHYYGMQHSAEDTSLITLISLWLSCLYSVLYYLDSCEIFKGSRQLLFYSGNQANTWPSQHGRLCTFGELVWHLRALYFCSNTRQACSV